MFCITCIKKKITQISKSTINLKTERASKKISIDQTIKLLQISPMKACIVRDGSGLVKDRSGFSYVECIDKNQQRLLVVKSLAKNVKLESMFMNE